MSTTTAPSPVRYRLAPEQWAGRECTVELHNAHPGYDVSLAGEHLGYAWVDRVTVEGDTTWGAATPIGVDPRHTTRSAAFEDVLVFLVNARTARALGRPFEDDASVHVPFSHYRCAHLRALHLRANARRARSMRGAR